MRLRYDNYEIFSEFFQILICEKGTRIHVDQKKNQWWKLVKNVISFGFHKGKAISSLAKWPWASQEGFCSTH
jgi:hypothetical protein